MSCVKASAGGSIDIFNVGVKASAGGSIDIFNGVYCVKASAGGVNRYL